MAKDFDVQVKGLKDLRKDLRATDRETLKEVQKVLKDAAGLAAATASELAPRRESYPPGTKPGLSESFKPFTRGNIAGVRSNLPYAGVFEYGGTIRPKGLPIEIRKVEPIHRAIERQRAAIVDHIGDGIEAAARRTGWR